jgi:hypothetical protein
VHVPPRNTRRPRAKSGSPMPVQYGQALIIAVLDEKHNPAIRFYINISQAVGLKERP